MSSSALLEHYVQARSAELASRHAASGTFALRPRPAQLIISKGDTLRAWLEDLQHQRLVEQLPDPVETFRVESLEAVSRLKISEFRDAFSSTQWAFTGSNSRAVVDTMRTSDIRARLQTLYGAPTRTLHELPEPDSLTREQILQFEYWFVVNDSINVVVMDVNGPWDRGVVLAADMRFRTELRVMKESFLGQHIPQAVRTPFTDYFYNVDQQAWYLTGWDGASFFDERIGRPDKKLGRPATRRSELNESPLPESSEQE